MLGRSKVAIVEVENLVKTFRTKIRHEGRMGTLKSLINSNIKENTAVGGISFNVEKGECLAYLGPNGAGKSTTIKMLTGILGCSRNCRRYNGSILPVLAIWPQKLLLQCVLIVPALQNSPL